MAIIIFSNKGFSKELMLLSGDVTATNTTASLRGEDLHDDSKLGIVFPCLTL